MNKIKVTIFESIHEAGIEELKTFADVDFKLGAPRDIIKSASSESDVIIVKSVTKVDSELLDNSNKLKIVARAGTGLDNIDVSHATKIGKKVFSVPTGNTVSAAEFATMQILNGCKQTPKIMQFVQKNDFRRHLLEGKELSEQTVGLIGLGNVGIEVAKRLANFNCKIIAWDPNSRHQETFSSLGGKMVDSMSDITDNANIISLHCLLNSDTKNMINNDFLAKCNDGVIIVNTARGGLIDEDELLENLKSGKVASYYADVLKEEPPFDVSGEEHDFSHPFLECDNVFITPHVAASTYEAQKRIAVNLVNQIKEEIRTQEC